MALSFQRQILKAQKEFLSKDTGGFAGRKIDLTSVSTERDERFSFNFGLKTGKVYRLRFYPVFGLKSFAPTIKKLPFGKMILTWGFFNESKKELIVYVIPLKNPIPVGLVIGTIAALVGGAIFIALLREVKDVSGIFYVGFGVVSLYLAKQMGLRL